MLKEGTGVSKGEGDQVLKNKFENEERKKCIEIKRIFQKIELKRQKIYPELEPSFPTPFHPVQTDEKICSLE